MKKEQIEDIICGILMDNGDGHTDGSEEITDFIYALLKGKEEKYIKQYKSVYYE